MDLLGRGGPPTLTVRQRLREELAPLHERLDARITDACLLPRADLRRLLAVYAHAFPPVVSGLQAAGAERLWPGWTGLRGLPPCRRRRGSARRAAELPRLKNSATIPWLGEGC